jgi:hypothetical protein
LAVLLPAKLQKPQFPATMAAWGDRVGGIKMKSNAAGQLFGYSLQFPRVLLRLLQAEIDAKVGIEVCGDVAVFFPEGITLTEEDKSSLLKNAIADTSSNLWKTFYNWINAINNKELEPKTDRFIIYTNHRVPSDSIVMKLNNAQTQQEVNSIIQLAQKKLENIGGDKNLFRYKKEIFENNLNIFRDIIPRFELIIDHKADDVYNSIRNEIRKKYVQDDQIEYLLEALSGWLQKTTNQLIAQKKQAIISFSEFDKQFKFLFKIIRSNDILIDYALSKMPAKQELAKKAKKRPIYVRQLEIIKLTQDKIIRAVSDYFKADTNRQQWIEKGLVDESSMQDFESRLISFYTNLRQRILLTNSQVPKEDQGELILLECQQRQERIANMDPPDRTVQGSYHVLSDELRVGWHPQWVNIFSEIKEGV